MEFVQGDTVESECQWEVTTGFKSDTTISAKVKIPFIGGGEASEEVELSMEASESEKTTHSQVWSVKDSIKIPPKTWVNATFLVTETDITADWTAKVGFKGCVSIKREGDSDGYRYPVTDIYGGLDGFECKDNGAALKRENNKEPFVNRIGGSNDLLDDCEQAHCSYITKGTYTGISGAKSHVQTASKPFGEEEGANQMILSAVTAFAAIVYTL